MKHIYYFFAFFAILWESGCIIETKKVHEFIIKLKADSKNKKFDELSNNQKSLIFLQLFYGIWAFIGLFTFQWSIYIVFFITSFIPKKNIIARKADAIISLLILFFIILNTYHFKIDIWEYIKLLF